MSQSRRKTLIFFEMHFDPLARELISQNLAWFQQNGFDKFAFEIPANVSLDTMINNFSQTNVYFKEIYAHLSVGAMSIQQLPSNMLIPLWQLPSNEIFVKLLRQVKSSGMQFSGIDAPSADRFNMPLAEHVKLATPDAVQRRNAYMIDQLIQLGQGTIALLGVNHAEGFYNALVAKIGAKAVEENYFFIMPASRLVVPIDTRCKILNSPQTYFPANLFLSLVKENIPDDVITTTHFRRLLCEACWNANVFPYQPATSTFSFLSAFNFFAVKEKALPEALQDYDRIYPIVRQRLG